MLKKFVNSLLVMTLLVACGGKKSETVEVKQSAQEMATQLVGDLGLQDSMKEIKQRYINGYFFEEEEVTSDASVFYSTETGNSDTVGVFVCDDAEKCKEYLGNYLEYQKSQTQDYYPEELFKISNAVIVDNGKVVVLVVCNDIEDAKTKANALIGK